MLISSRIDEIVKRDSEARQVGDRGAKLRGIPRPLEVRLRISAAQKGKSKNLSAEGRQRMRDAHAGKPLSQEHKKKISEKLLIARKGCVPSQACFEAAWASARGRVLSDEQKAEISRFHKARFARMREENISSLNQ